MKERIAKIADTINIAEAGIGLVLLPFNPILGSTVLVAAGLDMAATDVLKRHFKVSYKN